MKEEQSRNNVHMPNNTKSTALETFFAQAPLQAAESEWRHNVWMKVHSEPTAFNMDTFLRKQVQ